MNVTHAIGGRAVKAVGPPVRRTGLSMYNDPPNEMLTLEDFEVLAFERLKGGFTAPRRGERLWHGRAGLQRRVASLPPHPRGFAVLKAIENAKSRGVKPRELGDVIRDAVKSTLGLGNVRSTVGAARLTAASQPQRRWTSLPIAVRVAAGPRDNPARQHFAPHPPSGVLQQRGQPAVAADAGVRAVPVASRARDARSDQCVGCGGREHALPVQLVDTAAAVISPVLVVVPPYLHASCCTLRAAARSSLQATSWLAPP